MQSSYSLDEDSGIKHNNDYEVKVISPGASALGKRELSQKSKDISLLVQGPSSPGSGVIIARTGANYYALTAWHVLKNYVEGEELQVRTSDGQWHDVVSSSIKKIQGVDIAEFTFRSRNKYAIAEVGNLKSLSPGDDVFVSGFPLPTSSVPKSIHRFLEGSLVALSGQSQADGYDLLYSNPTLPGMSGGPVLSKRGGLIGVHGRAETDVTLSEQEGIAVKTGINQAIPITHVLKQLNVGSVQKDLSLPDEHQQLIAAATQKIDLIKTIRESTHRTEWKNDQRRNELNGMSASLAKQAVDLVSASIVHKKVGYSYYLRGTYKLVANGYQLDQYSEDSILSDFKKALSLDDQIAPAYLRIASMMEFNNYELGDKKNLDVIRYYEKALSLDPFLEEGYLRYGAIYWDPDHVEKKLAIYERGLKKIPTSARLNWEVANNILAIAVKRSIKLQNEKTDAMIKKNAYDFDNQPAQNKRIREEVAKEMGYRKILLRAEKLLDTSLAMNPGDSFWARRYRADVRDKLGNKKGAIDDYSIHISTSTLVWPEDLAKLSDLYREAGNHSGIVDTVDTAFLLQSKKIVKFTDFTQYANLYIKRAQAYEAMGIHAKACEDLGGFLAYGGGYEFVGSKEDFASWAGRCNWEVPKEILDNYF
ncbi:serine protease [Synechococcus sp. LTW-R]|uniref:S1 family peptidase n=1 Tax=Synechococcus sp. LTW-R TaxID=2751170 RepID=UPI0016233FC9|nr:serine protease [Synechococcus sp. LTW-R]QNG30614.1 trypsin-like peptidase domain-containing protein [Synechococcus sp. LTW-R]